MNRTFISLLIKFVITFFVTWFAFGLLIRNNFMTIVALSVVVTVLNYLVGDLIILKNFDNSVASIVDLLLSALMAFVFSLINPDFRISLFTIIVFAVIIGIFEYFYHNYLRQIDYGPTE